ncbi:hypothetical protein [Nostoc commune]|nr:hypothetical protein [Nostoc commune]
MKELLIWLASIFGLNLCPKNPQQQGQANRPIPVEDHEESTAKQRESVSLCLVIPASAAYNLRINSSVNVSDLKELIDNASYFLCTESAKVKSIDESLVPTNEDIASVNERKRIYIRINIPNAQTMIGKDSQYSLKENLPLQEQGTIEKIYCLKYLSGLEAFNSI